MQGGGVGSHSAERGKPRCPKSFQQLILLCSSLHHQTRPFLPYLPPLHTSPQPTGLSKRDHLSLSGLFLSLLASPVMSPVPPALPVQPPLRMASLQGQRCRGGGQGAQLIAILQGNPQALGAFCGRLREHQLFFLATGHPVQEPARQLGGCAARAGAPCQEPRQPLGQHLSHSMALKVQVTLGEMCPKRTSSLGCSSQPTGSPSAGLCRLSAPVSIPAALAGSL